MGTPTRLERGIASGELRSNLDIGVMLSMLAAVLSSTMNAWVLDAEPFDLRATLKRKTRFLFDAARRTEETGRRR